MRTMILRYLILACAVLAGGCWEGVTTTGPSAVVARPCPSPSPGTYPLDGRRVEAVELCGEPVR